MLTAANAGSGKLTTGANQVGVTYAVLVAAAFPRKSLQIVLYHPVPTIIGVLSIPLYFDGLEVPDPVAE